MVHKAFLKLNVANDEIFELLSDEETADEFMEELSTIEGNLSKLENVKEARINTDSGEVEINLYFESEVPRYIPDLKKIINVILKGILKFTKLSLNDITREYFSEYKKPGKKGQKAEIEVERFEREDGLEMVRIPEGTKLYKGFGKGSFKETKAPISGQPEFFAGLTNAKLYAKPHLASYIVKTPIELMEFSYVNFKRLLEMYKDKEEFVRKIRKITNIDTHEISCYYTDKPVGEIFYCPGGIDKEYAAKDLAKQLRDVAGIQGWYVPPESVINYFIGNDHPPYYLPEEVHIYDWEKYFDKDPPRSAALEYARKILRQSAPKARRTIRKTRKVTSRRTGRKTRKSKTSKPLKRRC